ncbi:MBL fold metallo-hydrolase [Microbulbifer sp. TYP-18]|uniref:MBL fold metallo-hydrolase n=1 Tax=Microbulbifer sp. TYP-18 TaxID=3230024 RepID=UPI0034C6420D
MKTHILFIIGCMCISFPLFAQINETPTTGDNTNKPINQTIERINNKQWIHGASDCIDYQGPAIDQFKFDTGSFILRQSKCTHYEAPFIYVLFGNKTVLVLDTGATSDPQAFPLYQTIMDLAENYRLEENLEPLNILVMHSHGHRDHMAADSQFTNQPNVELIEANGPAMNKFIGPGNWPNITREIDLGGRILTIIPSPGHQEQSIAIYDSKTQWLLTGDTLYPGRLYVRNWKKYLESIKRLVEFSQNHNISAVLGGHIEMSKTPGEIYPVGSTYQPNETGLALSIEQLRLLHELLTMENAKKREINTEQFIVSPLSNFQKIISSILKIFI